MLDKILILLILMTSPCLAGGIGHIATQEQLERLCVDLVLVSDHDDHWFYYKSIVSFDQSGVTVKGHAVTFILRSAIENFDEAYAKYQLLESIKP